MPGTNPDLPLEHKIVELRFKLNIGEVNFYTFRLDGKYSFQNIFSLTPLNVPDDIFTAHQTLEAPVQYNSLPIQKACGRIHSNDRVIAFFTKPYLHYFVDTSGTMEHYLGNFRSKTRNSLKRKIKKAVIGDGNSLKVVTEKEEIRDFLKDAWTLSEKTYQERLLGRPLPRDEEFIQRCEQAAAKGKLVGIILYINNTPVAYNFCPIDDSGILLYDYTGYDPAYSKFSPGTVVQYETIKYAFENPGIRFYDLCTGDGPHKELFATGSVLCCNAFIFPRKLKYQFMVWIRSLTDNISDIIKTVLNKIGVKDLIKRVIRRRG